MSRLEAMTRRWRTHLPEPAARGRAHVDEVVAEDSPPNGETRVRETMTAEERRILDACAPLTMTSELRVLALVDAVRHVVRHDVPGDLAECGVWRGGSILAIILTLQSLGVGDRDIHLYDTFAGMTAPTETDTSRFDRPALEHWNAAHAAGEHPWEGVFGAGAFGERAVQETLARSGYAVDHLHFHVGDVLETIPDGAPERLALLRLDTDWYASTRHELQHLYPRLSTRGVLIVDDYGHWDGARRAVDEYFGDRPPLLHRIDYTGRMAVKLA